MPPIPDAIPGISRAYRTPELLQDIRLLDLLELSGTTVHAGALLNLSQPTVSRRYNLLAQDFGLERLPGQANRCRYGSTEAMRWLRLGCRAHRLAAGVARLGADLMHQPLLAGMDWLLPSPPRFRPLESWLELVREGVLDGALVSALEWDAAGLDGRGDLELLRLGAVSLSLAVAPATAASRLCAAPVVLVPEPAAAPGLRRSLAQLGLQLKTAGSICQGPEHWLERLRSHPLAMALPELEASGWWQPLQRLPLPAALQLPMVLLLPSSWRQTPVLVHTAEQLRSHPALLPRRLS